MKIKYMLFSGLMAFFLVFTGCASNQQGSKDNNAEDVSEEAVDEADAKEGWQNAYETFLEAFYKKNKENSHTIYEFSVRDLDASGVPELIILKNGLKVTIYTYKDTVVKVGRNDFGSGTTRFLVSDNPSCPGIFIYSVGGGYEWYRYLTLEKNQLKQEKLWNKDYSGISKILGKKRKKIKETSKDKQLIQESKDAYRENNRLLVKTLQPDNYKYVEDFESIVDFLHVAIGMDKLQVQNTLKGRQSERWQGSPNFPESCAIYDLKSGGEIRIFYSCLNPSELYQVWKMEYHEDGKSVDNDYLARAKKILGLDLGMEHVVRLSDTKGVFWGEGDALLELQYSHKEYKAIKEKLVTEKHWKKFPMKFLSVEALLSTYLLPLDFEMPKRGYYLFYDRHEKAASHYDYRKITKRGSMSFSVCILDDAADKIIYIEEDS